MLQVLRAITLVLAVIFAGIVVLGLGIAAVNWLSGSGGVDAAPPSAAADSNFSQTTPRIDVGLTCGAGSTASAPVCDADGPAPAAACDTAVPAASPALPAAALQAPAIDREPPAQTKTATFALG